MTRRDIFDSLTLERIDRAGPLEEPDLLARIFDLADMRSTDGRVHARYMALAARSRRQWQYVAARYDAGAMQRVFDRPSCTDVAYNAASASASAPDADYETTHLQTTGD
jgi:hypothetical protein